MELNIAEALSPWASLVVKGTVQWRKIIQQCSWHICDRQCEKLKWTQMNKRKRALVERLWGECCTEQQEQFVANTWTVHDYKWSKTRLAGWQGNPTQGSKYGVLKVKNENYIHHHWRNDDRRWRKSMPSFGGQSASSLDCIHKLLDR